MKVFRLHFPIFLMLCALFISERSFAQREIYQGGEGLVSASKLLREKKYEKKLLGNDYVVDQWQLADILLTGDTIEFRDVNIKLDVTNRVIELQSGEDVKLLPSTQAKSITIKGVTPTFYLTRVGTGLYGPSGFYKLLYEGDEKLLCHYSTRIEQSHYNEALGSGQKDDKIVKVETYYISNNDKLIALEMKKSKLAEQLGNSEDLLKYMKEEGLNPKREMDLIKIVQYADKQRASAN